MADVRVLISSKELQARIDELAAAITADYQGTRPVLICVLKGAVFFIADLTRRLPFDLEIEFMAVSSYGHSSESSGVVRILKDLDTDIEGRHVLIVEDIIDSGLTLQYLTKTLKARNPASLEVVTLLSKPSRRKADLECRYTGFEIPNEFVVGYGLDHAENYRNLPYLGVVDERE
ncbi:MAG: hypoxanthine phosphoribosyltransferase [Actinobacteria bacterium]|nr:hypoxanthine phosphoribosyltransferase [Actinomycetota bacterium]